MAPLLERLRQKRRQRRPSNWPFLWLGIGAVFVAFAISDHWKAPAFVVALLPIVAGGVPLVQRVTAKRKLELAAEAVARKEREARSTEAAAQAVRDAEDRQRQAEAEKEFAAEEARMRQASGYKRLHMQVSELLNYANRLKPGSDNRQLILTMMEAVGQIGGQRDIEPGLFEEEGIASDIGLLFAQLDRMGMQQEMVYQRAKRVLRQESAVP